MTPIIGSLSDLDGRYDVLFCDLWGCLHDGKRVYPAAVEALRRFRARGGVVILMTNAPRPAWSVERHLERLGCPLDVRDGVVSSGDAAVASVNAGEWGRRVFHIGADKDEAFFEAARVERVALEEAESVIVTGLVDDLTETPDDYAERLAAVRARGLRMLSANPDVHVDVGERRIWCAGGIALAYEALGGETASYGKPHPPIYAMGRAMVESRLGRPVEDARILCVGDGIHTDVAGGVAQGLDTLFVTGGLAAPQMGDDVEAPDPEKLEFYIASHGLRPTVAIGRLR
ncbi:TIGR01459 family HAD-type hydrolase [Albimonas pacifica]|uniref:HAD-superfamily class IIA hydrolase, TIGR01459 n=1 Tax=Albimonas pacifica TaxID=1114924 RepID=A0A1I3INU4_9RHOB|nr:TIGR01459 family HAD-type hydrolase [Albimonas pacifica]SFI49559.1 HAD-superfamily class IIA hydrolase, TIGR01459 [Albimonas pacifica]